MPRIVRSLLLILLVVGCKSTSETFPEMERVIDSGKNADFTITFGSCNKTEIQNLLWDDILGLEPDLWIWGGDNIYADTDDIAKMQKMYLAQEEIPAYQKLKRSVPIIGTWDDHDYGVNDGGVEFRAKDESQQAFLDFMGVSKESPRRKRKGVYTAHDYALRKGNIKVIVLDTRYFRTPLTDDESPDRRYAPNPYGVGTVLGKEQWAWLKHELETSTADFNLIVSSVQVLSNEHGFESWAKFPHELDRLKKTVLESKAKGIIVLSGDRHTSEFSRVEIEGLPYPLIDFTSSGLTHAYHGEMGKEEPNPFRVGQKVFTESFGVLHFYFDTNSVVLQMLSDGPVVEATLRQQY